MGFLIPPVSWGSLFRRDLEHRRLPYLLACQLADNGDLCCSGSTEICTDARRPSPFEGCGIKFASEELTVPQFLKKLVRLVCLELSLI